MDSVVAELVQDFNQYDWVVVGLIAVSAFYGLVRGFAREVTSFLGWVGAFFLANVLALPISETLIDLIDDRSIRYLVAWGLIFISVVFFFGSVGRWLSSQLRQPGLNFGNRLLGAGFGTARGVIIAAAFTLMLRGVIPSSEASLLEESELIDDISLVAEWLADNFDDVINSEVPSVVDETLTQSTML